MCLWQRQRFKLVFYFQRDTSKGNLHFLKWDIVQLISPNFPSLKYINYIVQWLGFDDANLKKSGCNTTENHFNLVVVQPLVHTKAL